MPSTPSEQHHEPGSWKLSAAICVVILAVAGSLAFATFTTEPTTQKEGATKKTPMLVDVMEVSKGKHHPHIYRLVIWMAGAAKRLYKLHDNVSSDNRLPNLFKAHVAMST